MATLPAAVATALQEQLTKERGNEAVYRSAQWALDFVGWPGSSKFMGRAAKEEHQHAQKIANYLTARNVAPAIDALSNVPVVTSGDLLVYFKAALALEQANTESIRSLYFLAEQEEDLQTCQFLQWFLKEQTRSERELTDIIDQLARCDANGRTVLDHRIGKK